MTNATSLVETACRDFIADHPDVPIVVQTGVFPRYGYLRTPAGEGQLLDQWSVRLIPGLDGVAVSGSGQYLFGVNDNIGKTIIVTHATNWQRPDADEILSPAFQEAIGDAVMAKAAEVAADLAARRAQALVDHYRQEPAS